MNDKRICDIQGCWGHADPDTGLCARHGDLTNEEEDPKAIELVTVKVKYSLPSNPTVALAWTLVIGWPVNWSRERVGELAIGVLLTQLRAEGEHSPDIHMVAVQ